MGAPDSFNTYWLDLIYWAIAGARAYIFKAICGARDFWNDVCCKKVRSWSLNIPRMGMPPCDVRQSKKPSRIGSLHIPRRARDVQSEDCKTVCSPNSRPLRRAQGVQSAKSQIVGFLKPRFHCTTLRSLNRLAINAKSPLFRVGFLTLLGAWRCTTLAWHLPHYHRRSCVSLLSSEWIQVVPQRYCHQAKTV